MTQWASHPIQSTLDSMSLATQLGTYTKFAPKQKAATLATMYVPSATLANWPCRYGMCGTYVASNDVNVPARNFPCSRVYSWLTVSSQTMTMHVVNYSCNIFSTPIAIPI